MKEERIRRVLRQALGDFSRVDRPVIAGMAGAARPPVPAEGLMIEEALSFTVFSSRGRRKHSRRHAWSAVSQAASTGREALKTKETATPSDVWQMESNGVRVHVAS